MSLLQVSEDDSSCRVNNNNGTGLSNNDHIIWKLSDVKPDGFDFGPEGPIASTFIPRTIAWITVIDDDNTDDDDGDVSTTTTRTEIALLDGYTATCYTPPSIHFAATAIPKQYRTKLLQTKCCSLSVATTRDYNNNYNNNDNTNPSTVNEMTNVFQKAWNNGIPKSFLCTELGLSCSKINNTMYPPTISHSPIKMHCSLQQYVQLHDNNDSSSSTTSIEQSDDGNNDEAMIVLYVENFIVDGSVLSSPTVSMIQRNISAKIDASLIQAVGHLGNGIFSSLKSILSMPRPLKVKLEHDDNKDDSNKYINDLRKQWTSTDLIPISVVSTTTTTSSSSTCTNSSIHVPKTSSYSTMEWNWRIDGASCLLGFNPTTALIMPRPIGWISTYTKEGRYKHLAPYSFTIDVGRYRTSTTSSTRSTKGPMIAFSAFRTNNGTTYKDAQKNAEETGVFCCNCVTANLAVPMNYTAAELSRTESEFELSGLHDVPAKFIDAPSVADSLIVYECIYHQTINVASFSIVVGEIIAIVINRSILSPLTNRIDPIRFSPLARLGYMDEYGLFF